MPQLKPHIRIRTRIAPSPTGPLHFGTLRTALFNYLFAKHHGGQFIVRIEDTDPERSKPAFERNILDGLQWAGLTWDEGPDRGGTGAPYRQSERGSVYAQYYELLAADDQSYEKDGARYFRVPKGQLLTVDDMIRGKIQFTTDDIADFVIRKSDGTPPFLFANAVDDAAMEISHVIRGEDHLSNTPRQLLLYRAFGAIPPVFAHLPLILNPDRTKMSKRIGDVDVDAYRRQGYLPEALVNFMVFLGWNPKTTEEFFTLPELVQRFDLTQVHKAGAVFDLKRLKFTNNHYQRRLSDDAFVDYARETLVAAGLAEDNDFHILADRAFLARVLASVRERVEVAADIPDLVRFFFTPREDYDPRALIWRQSTYAETLRALTVATKALEDWPAEQFLASSLEQHLRAVGEQVGLPRGAFFWPLRYALSHEDRSPGVFEMAAVLGKTETLRRLTEAHKRLHALGSAENA